MNRQKVLRGALFALLLLTIVACGAAPAASPAPAATMMAAPTATMMAPDATATMMADPTATMAPDATATMAPEPTESAAATPGEVVTVQIQLFQFKPATVEVPLGATVT